MTKRQYQKMVLDMFEEYDLGNTESHLWRSIAFKSSKTSWAGFECENCGIMIRWGRAGYLYAMSNVIRSKIYSGFDFAIAFAKNGISCDEYIMIQALE